MLKHGWAQVAAQDAQRAAEQDRRVFLLRVPKAFGDAGHGSVSGAAEQVEAVEAQGWRLEQMAVDRETGYFLFRR